MTIKIKSDKTRNNCFYLFDYFRKFTWNWKETQKILYYYVCCIKFKGSSFEQIDLQMVLLTFYCGEGGITGRYYILTFGDLNPIKTDFNVLLNCLIPSCLVLETHETVQWHWACCFVHIYCKDKFESSSVLY